MNAWTPIKFLFLICLAFLVSACYTSPPVVDPKVSTTWEAPKRLDSAAVFNASLKSLSRVDLDIISQDRQTGVITAKKVIQLPLIRIPSQVPITVNITKTGDHSTLNTTAYLKGISSESQYEIIIKEFYDSLFLELKVVKPEEKVITRN